MTDLRRLAVVTDYAELHQALRDRRDELGISSAVLNELAGNSNIDKLLFPQAGIGATRQQDRRRNRAVGFETLGPLLWGLGLVLIVAEDPVLTARHRRSHLWRERDAAQARAAPHHSCQPSIDEMLRERTTRKLMEIGANGGRARAAKLSSIQRQRIARNASNLRWKIERRARQIARKIARETRRAKGSESV